METEELRSKLLEEVAKLPQEQAAGLKERIEGMNPEELLEFVKQSSASECFFCNLTSGKIETVKVYESANIFAILDINPLSAGHMLVMPKQHFQFIPQLPDAVLYELFSFVKYISPVLLQVVNAVGIDVYIAQGISQRVPHLAVNIIPRFKDDKVALAGERKKASKDELENIAAAIRQEAKSIPQKAIQGTNEQQEQKAQPKQEKTAEERETEAMLKFYKGKL